tara:strand:- start:372 stop:650 length:279 start_codon:yes stop_codon:yes gene_type:complete
MTVTYTLKETFTGKRAQVMPDPDGDGEKTEEVTVTDIIVEFTKDDKKYTRPVNVVFDSDGNYDDAATKERCEQVAMGVENKIAVGAIFPDSE